MSNTHQPQIDETEGTGKPKHFTYDSNFSRDGDLSQGDILARTEDLRSIFKDAHADFLSDEYTGFLVLTQTCDLERRDGSPCKSPYVNLAGIRPLKGILSSLLGRIQLHPVTLNERAVPGLFAVEGYSHAKMLLERIFNQNEHAMGLFYLHREVDLEIAEPSVALLQVSISIRARALRDSQSGSRWRLSTSVPKQTRVVDRQFVFSCRHRGHIKGDDEGTHGRVYRERPRSHSLGSQTQH